MAERDDVQLTQDVRDELDRVLDSVATDVRVRVQDGAVVMTGRLPSYADKLVVEDAIARMAGVRAVASELSVRVRQPYRPDDPDLAEAAARALSWNASVPDSVRAVVDGGWITLEGEVASQRERLAAEQAVSMLVGVSGVTNHVRVRPHAAAGELQGRVERALARSAFVDEHRVRVHINGGAVTLRGIARSWAERSEAERLAWMTPGVATVENEVSVGVPATPDGWGPLLDRIEGSGQLPADVAADDAVRAVLCALSLHTTPEEVVVLAAALPGELNRLLHPCARHRHRPPEAFDHDGFMRHVAEHLLVTVEEAAVLTTAIFAALKRKVPTDVTQDIAARLPGELGKVWRTAA